MGELKEALALAKYLKDTALKAKRSAGSSISPEKLAQLVAKLEEMREKLAWLGREHDADKSKSQWLQSQLNQKTRSMELERQFLPLIHKIRGPIGPQNEVLCSKTRMSQTQSMGNLGPPAELGSDGNRTAAQLAATSGFH